MRARLKNQGEKNQIDLIRKKALLDTHCTFPSNTVENQASRLLMYIPQLGYLFLFTGWKKGEKKQNNHRNGSLYGFQGMGLEKTTGK